MTMAHFVVRKKLPKLKSYIIVFSVSSTRNFYQSTFATFVATYSEDPNKSSELIVILWKFLPAEKAYLGLNYYQFFFSFPTELSFRTFWILFFSKKSWKNSKKFRKSSNRIIIVI